jgi:tRNA pseudouridine38-40 synthase
MATFRITLEYDGSGFEGWQVQPGGHRTVQGVLEEALERVTGTSARVMGAGRTDSGVHAEAQVASVQVDTDLSPESLCRALNGVLPRDLAAQSVAGAPEGFDARRDAKRKRYCYRIWNGPTPSPLHQGRFLRVATPLDRVAMQRAADSCVGRHDFTSFRATRSDARSSVRTLDRVTVHEASPGEIEIEVEGQGFLRHMVRILAGTLIEVGRGRRDPASIPSVLAARDRAAAGPTAPGLGLTLVGVDY